MKNLLKIFAFFSILLCLALIANSVLGIRPVSAQVPFGGLVLTLQPCPDQGGFLITVGPPVPGVFYAPPSVYAVGFPTIGFWTLGLAIPAPVTCSAAGIGVIGVGLPIIPLSSGFFP